MHGLKRMQEHMPDVQLKRRNCAPGALQHAGLIHRALHEIWSPGTCGDAAMMSSDGEGLNLFSTPSRCMRTGDVTSL